MDGIHGRAALAAERNGALVRRAVAEIWNGGDLALADRLFAPGYVNHGGLVPDLVRGPEAIKFSVVLYRAAFPRFELTIVDLLAHGETFAVRWTARSAPAAEALGRTPAEAQGTLGGMTSGRVIGGRIVESWTCWDRTPVPSPSRDGGTGA
jgi:hypothetical protein